MMNENLPFVIPATQSNKEVKPGRKGYAYFGDPGDFMQHKKHRIAEVRTITEEIKKEKPKISNPQQLSFLDIELDVKATSQSSTPVELFDAYQLDVNKRVAPNKVVVSGSEKAINDFKTAIEELQYVPQLNDGGNYKNKGPALLSAITKISKVSRDQKLEGEVKAENSGVAYFYKAISSLNAKKIADGLIKTHGLRAKYMVSPSGAKVLVGTFSANDVELLTNDDYENPFAKFEVLHRVGVATKSMNTTYPITEVNVDTDAANAIVGVVDSGIADLKVLQGLIVGRKDYTSKAGDKQHGTMVASRLIFGDDIEEQLFDKNKLVARAKVVDIKVMVGDEGPDPVDLIIQLEDAIKTFPYIKVFNMSIGLEDPCDKNKKTYLTRELDALQHKYGVTFVVAAGNRDDFYESSYPEVLFEESSIITPPADIINGLSVGSLTNKANNTSLANVDEPSPFTRLGFDGVRKPDLTHYGGNARASGFWRDLGVKGLSVTENELYEDVGTSHAAPLVSGEMAKALHVVDTSGYSNAADLTKALVVHSAKYRLNETSPIDPSVLQKIVGHGVPNVDEVLFADDTQIVYVMTGKVGGARAKSKTSKELTREAVSKVSFTIPEELKKLRRDLNVRATLAYTAPIDADDEVDTAQSDITMTLYKVNSKNNLVNSTRKDDADYSYKPKWFTIKSLERSYSARSYDGGEWELRLTLQTRGDASAKDFEQPFALVISIEDVGKDGDRINLQELIKVNHKQYVRLNELRNRARAIIDSQAQD